MTHTAVRVASVGARKPWRAVAAARYRRRTAAVPARSAPDSVARTSRSDREAYDPVAAAPRSAGAADAPVALGATASDTPAAAVAEPELSTRFVRIQCSEVPMTHRHRAVPTLLALLLALALAAPAPACTTFCLRDGGRIVFGKNYDWSVGDGLLIVNKRGVARRADAAGDPRPASWVSRYGSVTFNQYGRDFPSGGMNERGLTIELMWLDGSRYPTRTAGRRSTCCNGSSTTSTPMPRSTRC